MARRPLSEMVDLTVRVPRGHDGFWSIIGQLDASGPWTLRDVDEASNVDRASSKDYVHRLERGGFVERVGECAGKSGVAKATLWRLLKKPIDAPRLDRHGNERPEPVEQLLWRSMRILKSFTCRDLHAAAALPDRPIALQTARHYVAALASVGVLISPQGKRGPHVTYHLVRDLGPKFPSVSRTDVVFDQNSRTIIGTPTIEVRP